jgi:streptogramin lyase
VEELEGLCLLSPGLRPEGQIAVGPDGNLWFPEFTRVGELNRSTGVIQEFAVPDGPSLNGGIAVAKNGIVWLTRSDRIDRLDPVTGGVQEFFLSSGESTVGDIAAAGDGTVWFNETKGIAELDPTTGQIKAPFAPAGANLRSLYSVGAVIAGPDGSIWFSSIFDDGTTVSLIGSYVRIDPAGDTSAFRLALPGLFTIAPNGTLWFSDYYSPYVVGELDPTTGTVQIIGNNNPPPLSIGLAPPFVRTITAGADGTIWFLDFFGISGVNPGTGALKQFSFPQGTSQAMGMAAGADGSIWFTEEDAIGQFNPNTGTFQFFDTASNTASQGTSNPTVSNNSISATGTNVSALAGINFTTAVASFTPQAPIATPGQAYQATVDWGDGTTSSIVLTVTASGTYDVVASHAYQTAGTYSIKVTIGNFDPANPLGDNPITIFSTANVDPFLMNM